MKKLYARDVLFSEGDSDGKMFIVRKGAFVVQKREGSKIRTREILLPHSVVGGDSLLNETPHAYTLRAMETSEVEEIAQEDLSKAFRNSPAWFPQFLRFMENRVNTLKKNKSTFDKVHAIPAFLFICAKYAKHAEEARFDLERLAEDVYAINGLSYGETLELLRGFCHLGAAEITDGEIRFYRKNLPELLYRTLLARMSGAVLPKTILSASDQTILTAFISAAKTKGHGSGNNVYIQTKDFTATYGTLYPGIKLTRRAFIGLVECGYLSSHPEFSTRKTLDEFEEFHGDREAIKDLLELNRVYPLLDKRLLKAMNPEKSDS